MQVHDPFFYLVVNGVLLNQLSPPPLKRKAHSAWAIGRIVVVLFSDFSW